jgi:hypothetical protein
MSSYLPYRSPQPPAPGGLAQGSLVLALIAFCGIGTDLGILLYYRHHHAWPSDDPSVFGVAIIIASLTAIIWATGLITSLVALADSNGPRQLAFYAVAVCVADALMCMSSACIWA